VKLILHVLSLQFLGLTFPLDHDSLILEHVFQMYSIAVTWLKQRLNTVNLCVLLSVVQDRETSSDLSTTTWCGRKVMRLATLCTNWQCCCLPLHMAVRL